MHPVSINTINKYVSKTIHSMRRDALILSLMSKYNLPPTKINRNIFSDMSNKELASRYIRTMSREERTRLYVNHLRMKGEEIPYFIYGV